LPDLSEQAVLLWTSREIGGLGCNYSKTPIRTRMSRTAKDIVEIGRELIAAKERIGSYPNYLGWIKSEFGMNAAPAACSMKSRCFQSSRSAAPRFIGRRRRAGFRGQRTSRRTGGFGTKMKSWRGRTRSTSSIRTVAGAKVVAIMHRTDKSAFEGKPGTEWC
jgi:hypothetical protein